MQKTRERFVLMGAVAFAITLMLVLVAFKEPIEREVSKDSDDYRRGWILNKPIRFMTLPNEVHGELNYTFFPTGVCNQSASYDSYELSEISMCNVEIMNSDISNAYFHNATIHECNIEDATIINSSIENCWIGQNVTIINCPPGSDPAAGKELSAYFNEEFEDIYDLKIGPYSSDIALASSYFEEMDSDPFSHINPETWLLRESVRNITNNTICDIYPIFNLSSSQNNCAETIINSHKIKYHGFYSDSPERINITVYLEMYLKPDSNLSHYDYYGYIDYRNLSNQSRTWDNDVSINYSNRIRNNNYWSSYKQSTYLIDGDNSTQKNNKLFKYYDYSINVIISDDLTDLNYLEYNTSSQYLIYQIDDDLYSYCSESTTTFIGNDSSSDTITFIGLGLISNTISVNNKSEDAAKSPSFKDWYCWNELGINDGISTRISLTNNGSFIDPHGGKITKSNLYKNILGKKIKYGYNLEYWFQLTEKDVDFIDKTVHAATGLTVAIGTVIAGLLGIGIGFLNVPAGGAAFIILEGLVVSLGITIEYNWGVIKNKFQETSNRNNKDNLLNDIELKIIYEGRYFATSKGQTRYYVWDYNNGTNSDRTLYYKDFTFFPPRAITLEPFLTNKRF